MYFLRKMHEQHRHDHKITQESPSQQWQTKPQTAATAETKESCPLPGKCLAKSLVYEATVESQDGVKK